MGLNGNTNEAKIWNYFKSKGLNDFGCAGIIGNLYAESGLKPNNLQNTGNTKLGMTDDEYVAAIDNRTYTKEQFVYDGQGAFLAQWTYWSRKKALYEFMESRGVSAGDLEMQLDFIYKELSESYKSVFAVLKTATSVREASDAVLVNYERPAVIINGTEAQKEETKEKRAGYGQKYYDLYAQKTDGDGTSADIPTQGGKGTMKYNANNKPIVCMQTNSTCYKGTSKMTVKGVLWHSTGANNPWIKRYVQPSDNASDRAEMLELIGKNAYGNDWNHISRQAGLNCWVGKLADGTVSTVQTMPWDYKPWGCGGGSKGSCNNGWIQFEICEDALTDETYFNAVYKEACEITAYLCDMYNLNPNGTATLNGVSVPVILCHADSYKLGLGSNHGDVLHWFKKHGKTMDDVRKDVASLMDKPADTTPNVPAPETKPSSPEAGFNVGDIVNFAGGKHYSSANATNGSAVKASKAKVTAVYKNGKHPYHCRAVNDAGAYIGGVYGWVNAADLTAIEAETPKTEPATPVTTTAIKKGDIVSIAKNATYYSGKDVPDWVVAKNWIVAETPVGDRVVVNKSADGKHAINSPIHSKFLTVVKTDESWTPKVGDIVNYNGNKHYANANAANGSSCKGGLAKITNIYQLGKSKHPYHLVRVSGKGATVYGWVNEGTFTKA